VKRAKNRGLDRLAITDHNTIVGGMAAWRIDPQLIVVGEEVLTTQGELLAFYIQESVPLGLTPEHAIRLLRQQGAVISVSHPFDVQRGGWKLRDLLGILSLVDAIEVFNARVYRAATNEKGAVLAAEKKIPGTAGSDAHSLNEVGAAYLELPEFNDSKSLFQALQTARPQGKLSGAQVRLASRWAWFMKKMMHWQQIERTG
jgi:hypothetical protein